MKVAKWGDDLAVRLPDELVESLGLQEGDEVDINVSGSHRLVITRKERIEQFLESLRPYRGSLPADYRFDRDEANER